MKLMKKSLSVVLAVLMIASVCVFSASAAETVTFGGDAVAIDGGKVIVPANAVYYVAADGKLCFPGDIIEATAGDVFTAATAAVAADKAFRYAFDEAGIRARGAVSSADIEAADEIGFVIVPKIAPDLTADFASSQYALKVPVADKAAAYGDASGIDGKQYQVLLKNLKYTVKDEETKEETTIDHTGEKFLFALYVKTGDAYAYFVIGAQSYNSIPRTDLDNNIEAILAAGAAMESGTTSGYEVTITGTVASVPAAPYGNMNVEDANGNTIYVYGTYSSTGAVRYDAMEVQPKVGDEVTITGEIKNYNGTIQINNGRLMAHTVNEVEIPKIEGTQAILEAAYALAAGESLSGGVHEYTLTGTITVIDSPYSESFENISVYIVCDGLEAMPILCYRLKGADTAQTALIGVGDVITVTGKIKNYNGTVQFDQGCTFTDWVDNAEPEPTEPQNKTIAEVLAMTTVPSYEVIVEGVISGTYRDTWATYGNLYIKDSNGDEILIYGLYDSTGATRYDAMTTKPVVGDTIKVQSVVSFYNSVAQLKNAKLIAHTVAEPAPEEPEQPEEPELPTGSQVVFEFGDNGEAKHVDGNALNSGEYTSGGYTLNLENMVKVYGPAYDAMGNSCIKLGTSKLVGSFSFTVPDGVDSVVISIAKYKANTTKINVNGTDYTLTKNSNDGEYDQIIVDTSTTKTVSLTTVASNYRAMVNSITFVVGE